MYPTPLPPKRYYTYKIATLNINDLTAPTYVSTNAGWFSLNSEYWYPMSTGIFTSAINNIVNYNTHLNIGTGGRWTAIIAKEVYRMSNIRGIPNGRWISGRINGITIINLYAPAGREGKRERETFYNQDIPSLLHDYNEHTILTGDFSLYCRALTAQDNRPWAGLLNTSL
jgi:hypothetical protein